MQSVNAGQDFLALVDYAHKPGAVAGVVGTLKDYMPDPAELIEEIKDSLKAVVVLGVDRQVIADAVDTIAPSVDVAVVDSTDPHEAMQRVVRAARQYAAQGDSVILAPAAASLDMYSGMSQRGDLFAEYAMKGN